MQCSDDEAESGAAAGEAVVEHVDDGSVDRLEMRVQARPLDFTAHIELLAELRRKAKVLPDARVRMRAARDAFAATWPLPEEIWVELLQDEICGADLSDEPQRAAAEALCRRALADYLSVDLWVLYCDLVRQKRRPDSAGMTSAAFEAAIAAGAGLHLVEGSKIWAAYRDAMTAEGTAMVAKLFLRQLSVPLSGMEATMSEFEAFAESAHLDEATRDATRQAYETVRTALLARVPFERAIADSGTTMAPNYEKLAVWNEYLAFEQANGTPQQAMCLFERACKTYALSPEMWIAYIRFVETKFGKNTEIALPLYERASRNVPNSGSIWADRMRALERAGKTDAEIETTVVCKAKEMLADNPTGLVELLNANIDRVRRLCSIPGSSGNATMLERLRKTCSDAVDLVAPRKTCDASSLLQQWGRLEYRILGNPAKGHELWERAMRTKSADAFAWLEYVQLERVAGQVERCRSLFKRAVQVVTNPQSLEHVVGQWVQFEREEGTLEQLQQSYDRGSQRLQLALYAMQQQQAEVEAEAKTKPPKKRQHVQEQPQLEPKPEQQQQQQQQQSVDPKKLEERHAKTVHVKGLSPETVEDNLMQLFSTFGEIVAVRLGRNKQTGKSRGFAFVEFTTTEAVSATLAAADTIELLGKKLIVERSNPAVAQEEDAHKLFVSNMSFKITADELRKLFGQCEGLTDVVVICDQAGRSKGFAVLTFANESGVQSGLLLDKTMVAGRALKVQPYSKPARRTQPTQQDAEMTDAAPAAPAATPKEKVTFAVPRSVRLRMQNP